MADNRLTEMAVKNAKPREQPYKLADGEGLYLEVMPNGSRYWRLKYRFGPKEKRLALGVYPTITLWKSAPPSPHPAPSLWKTKSPLQKLERLTTKTEARQSKSMFGIRRMTTETGAISSASWLQKLETFIYTNAKQHLFITG